MIIAKVTNCPTDVKGSENIIHLWYVNNFLHWHNCVCHNNHSHNVCISEYAPYSIIWKLVPQG